VVEHLIDRQCKPFLLYAVESFDLCHSDIYKVFHLPLLLLCVNLKI